MAENLFAGIVLLLAALALYDFWKLINEDLPGDREILDLLTQTKALKAQSDQQSRRIIAEIGSVAAHTTWNSKNLSPSMQAPSPADRPLGANPDIPLHGKGALQEAGCSGVKA